MQYWLRRLCVPFYKVDPPEMECVYVPVGRWGYLDPIGFGEKIENCTSLFEQILSAEATSAKGLRRPLRQAIDTMKNMERIVTVKKMNGRQHTRRLVVE